MEGYVWLDTSSQWSIVKMGKTGYLFRNGISVWFDGKIVLDSPVLRWSREELLEAYTLSDKFKKLKEGRREGN